MASQEDETARYDQPDEDRFGGLDVQDTRGIPKTHQDLTEDSLQRAASARVRDAALGVDPALRSLITERSGVTDGEVKGSPDAPIIDILSVLMVEHTAENIEQMRVFLQAFDVFVERNRRHRAQWRVAGVRGLLVDIRKKCERLWNEFMLDGTPPQDVDSAIDMINYLAFFVQARAEEQRGAQVGTWIWPGEVAGSNIRPVSGKKSARFVG